MKVVVLVVVMLQVAREQDVCPHRKTMMMELQIVAVARQWMTKKWKNWRQIKARTLDAPVRDTIVDAEFNLAVRLHPSKAVETYAVPTESKMFKILQ